MEKKELYVGEFSDLYFPEVNGVVRVVNRLTENLDKKIHVFAGVVKRPHLEQIPYKVYYCKGFKVPIQGDTQSLVGMDKKYRKAIESERIDIIHCHTIGGQFSFAKKVAKKKNVPLVITVHTQTHYDLLKFFKFKWIVKKIMKGIVKKYNACDEIWALNEGMKDYCVEWGCDESKIRVVGNACDYHYPKNPQELINSVNKEYNLKEDEIVFSFLGRLIDYKNIYFIAEALKIVKDKGVKFKMFYIGDGIDKNNLKSLIKKLGLSDDVILTGTLEDKEKVGAILLRSKLLLFPSMFDAFGLVKLEAAAHKTPSLMIEGSVAASGFINNRNTFTAKEDVNLYAERIIEILNDETLYNTVCENAYKEMYISWEDYSDKIIEAYEDAIKKFKNKAK